MIKPIALAACLALTTATAACAGNAPKTAPPGGAYKPVHQLVPLPEFLPGMGTLYVDPDTLPAGPFAAYDRSGKLVSSIYMIPLDALQAQTPFTGLAVAGKTATAVDMTYNAGHPGVAKPHYHVVVWHVDPKSADVR